MTSFAGHPQAMLSEIYVEALLVDKELVRTLREIIDVA